MIIFHHFELTELAVVHTTIGRSYRITARAVLCCAVHSEETMIMFHHFEYVGEDFANDMKKLDNDPTIKFWWTQ